MVEQMSNDEHSDDDQNHDNYQPSTKNEQQPTRISKRSAESKKLVFLSSKVLEQVKKHSGATGTDIAQNILQIYHSMRMDMDFKNVQRRVYDALNVLCALGIVAKDKNRIIYLETPE
jgi:hypothetical protein